MEKKFVDLGVLAKGIAISFIITIILFYILGIILSCTSMPEKIINPSIIIITGISILISTSIVTIKLKEKGMIKGGLIGTIYFILIYLVSSLILKNFDVNVYSAIMFVVSFLCGAIGGIVGVNMQK
ncbi:MAG: TIGR04086 family membrane protein [Clostridia bacterium]|nr:TIGR04086 family membrane protein [Clostridia bacterium]